MPGVRHACVAMVVAATGCGTEYGAAEPSPADPDAGGTASGVDGGTDGGDAGGATITTDDFETAGADQACEGWVVDPGATATHVTDVVHGGSGACRLCAIAGAEVSMKKTVPIAGPGRYVFVAWLRRDTTAAYRMIANFGGSESGGSNVLPPAAWARAVLGTKTSSEAANATFGLAIGSGDAGEECIYVDDVSVTMEP